MTSITLPRVLIGNVHRGLLDGLELRAVLSGLVHDLRTADLELIALAAHGLHQDGQVQHATAGDAHAGLILSLIDAHGDVALLFAHQALLELTGAHDVAVAADERAGGSLEHDRHSGLLDGDGLHLHRVLRVGDNVADVCCLDADHGHDVAGMGLGNLGLAQVLEGVDLADGGVVLITVGLHDQHLLLFMQDAAVQTANADTTLVAAVVDGADLQGHRTLGVHIGARDLVDDGVKQRDHIHVAVFGLQAGIAVDCGSVHHGEIKLLVGSTQLDHQVEHLVHSALGIGVGAVDLVHDHHNAQAALERMGQHEARLRLGTLVGVHDEQGAVGHVEHALNLAAEVGVARGVDDVDLDVLVLDGDVLGKDGDAALALLIVGVQDALFHLLVLAENVGRPQQTVDQRSLTMVDVRDDGNVAKAFLLHTGVLLLFRFLRDLALFPIQFVNMLGKRVDGTLR